MAVLRDAAIRAGQELLALSGSARLLRRVLPARGIILGLNRVLPGEPADFAPNRALQVTPEFLDFAIRRVRQLGFDIVDLGEALRRIESDTPVRPFVVVTFDGAWRDTLRFALPVLRRQQCPFTLYIPTTLADGIGEPWLQALEELVTSQTALAVTAQGETEYLPAATLGEKRATWSALALRMRKMPEPERVALLHALASQYGLDLNRLCRELVMDWAELRQFASEQLCTIGANGVRGYELAKLPGPEMRREIEQSLRIIKAQYGRAPLHFAYAVGDAESAGDREFAAVRDLGLRSAVTTRPGGLAAIHRNSLYALPRLMLNGRFQSRRAIDVLVTGALAWMAPRLG